MVCIKLTAEVKGMTPGLEPFLCLRQRKANVLKANVWLLVLLDDHPGACADLLRLGSQDARQTAEHRGFLRQGIDSSSSLTLGE